LSDHTVTPQPTDTLQRKLVLWTVFIVVTATLACAGSMLGVAREAMQRTHRSHVMLLGQTVAAALAGERDGGGSADVLDSLHYDPRLAFAMVTDADGQTLHRRTADAEAWITFAAWRDRPGNREMASFAEPIVLSEERDLIVHRTPIWRAGDANDDSRELAGYVVLGLREPALAQTVAHLKATSIAIAGLICVVGSGLGVWVVRRKLRPLRALLDAIGAMRRGDRPDAVATSGRDEIALLAESFNDLMHHLADARLDLERVNRNLERTVAQRTDELRRAKERLEAEITDKNEFLRAVTHDLSAPLRNIQGMTRMLLNKHAQHLPEGAAAKLQRIDANVTVQGELIDDLLELSRLRTGARKQQEVAVGELIGEIRDSLSYDLERSGIEFLIEGPMPTIIADRNRLRQVFQNLLDNAVKYMLDSDERRVTVRAAAEQGVWHFIIADTGPGIDPRDQESIFQVFRRSHDAGSHQVAGRGVGLASVRAIVESYGGRIWLVSDRGRGSEFHFTLDRVMVDPAQHAAESAA